MTAAADTVEAFSKLVLALNGALAEGEPWRDFLLLLRDHLNAKHATLILTPPHTAELGTMITPTAPPAEVALYLERFLAIDPFVGLPDGQVVALYEYVGESELKNSDYYRGWFEGIDGSHVMGVDIRFKSGFEARLRITRAPGGEVFDRAERARLERIVPHLRQAIDLYQRLQTSASEQAVMTDAVAQFAVGTVMLDHSLNVLKMNEIAASILAEQDGLRLVGQRLAIDSARRDGEFRALLKAAIAEPGRTQPVFMVERPSGLRDIGIVVRSISIPDFMHTGTAPALALFLGDPERHGVVTGEALRELFGLTPTEAAISASLANGASVIDTARRLGIAENTVRAPALDLRQDGGESAIAARPSHSHQPAGAGTEPLELVVPAIGPCSVPLPMGRRHSTPHVGHGLLHLVYLDIAAELAARVEIGPGAGARQLGLVGGGNSRSRIARERGVVIRRPDHEMVKAGAALVEHFAVDRRRGVGLPDQLDVHRIMKAERCFVAERAAPAAIEAVGHRHRRGEERAGAGGGPMRDRGIDILDDIGDLHDRFSGGGGRLEREHGAPPAGLSPRWNMA